MLQTFQRRLRALGYVEWDKVDPKQQRHFRKVVLWLEEQKIRRYSIEARRELREAVDDDNWSKVLARYCSDLECPSSEEESDQQDPLNQLEWLLGHAIWLQVAENCEGCPKGMMDARIRSKTEGLEPTIKCRNPLDNLDFESERFKEETYGLAKMVRVPRHPDHLVLLKGCCSLVRSRLAPETRIVRGKPFSMSSIDSPFVKLKTPGLEDAAKALLLLYIRDLRILQTRINEAIVSVQRITANPKTDTRLGKVGK